MKDNEEDNIETDQIEEPIEEESKEESLDGKCSWATVVLYSGDLNSELVVQNSLINEWSIIQAMSWIRN